MACRELGGHQYRAVVERIGCYGQQQFPRQLWRGRERGPDRFALGAAEALSVGVNWNFTVVRVWLLFTYKCFRGFE